MSNKEEIVELNNKITELQEILNRMIEILDVHGKEILNLSQTSKSIMQTQNRFGYN